MSLVTYIVMSLTLWMCLCGVTTQEQRTGTSQSQGPTVKIGVSVEKPQSHPQRSISLNQHLEHDPNPTNLKPPLHGDEVSPTFLEDQTVASVIFNEVQSIVLTKSSYCIISNINFEPHLKTFTEISDLLQKTMDKTKTFMQSKSFLPYYRELSEDLQAVQTRKDHWISTQLKELSYELNLVMKNFGLIKNRFSEITGHSLELPPTSQIKIVPSEEPSQGSRSKRSVMSNIFRFLFVGEDNSEAINMLKQNVATLMANDELQEKCLKDLLQSQQCNAGEIKINCDLL